MIKKIFFWQAPYRKPIDMLFFIASLQLSWCHTSDEFVPRIALIIEIWNLIQLCGLSSTGLSVIGLNSTGLSIIGLNSNGLSIIGLNTNGLRHSL